MTDPLIRDATENDLGAMLVLWRNLEEAQGAHRILPLSVGAENLVEESFREAIGDPDSRALVAEDGGMIVGMALARFSQGGGLSDAGVVHLSRMVVDRGARGKGIGSALLAAAERFGRARGGGWVAAKIFSRNERGRLFWERHGFTPRYEERVRPILPAEEAE